MSTTSPTMIWVAYGKEGVVGSIRKADGEYTVTMAGADAAQGTYPTMEIAKNALHASMRPGSDWPTFEAH